MKCLFFCSTNKSGLNDTSDSPPVLRLMPCLGEVYGGLTVVKGDGQRIDR